MSFADVDLDLLITLTALLVGGLTGIIGMWVERDPDRGTRVFMALATLCLLTTIVSMYQAVGEARDAAKQEEAMANMLQKLDTIMQTAGVEVPAINELVKGELASASRENPNLVKKVAQRVADSGGNPASVLGSYLPADEVKRIQRSGTLVVKKPVEEHKTVAVAEPPVRKSLQFGDAPARVRPEPPRPQPSAAIPTAVAPAAPPAEAPAAAVPPTAPDAVNPTVAPPAGATPPAAPPAAAPTPTPAPAAKPVRKPAVRKAVPRGDVDIYEEAEQDLRRTAKAK
jgi:hypothetical protein